jgi:hypothetical protein
MKLAPWTGWFFLLLWLSIAAIALALYIVE